MGSAWDWFDDLVYHLGNYDRLDRDAGGKTLSPIMSDSNPQEENLAGNRFKDAWSPRHSLPQGTWEVPQIGTFDKDTGTGEINGFSLDKMPMANPKYPSLKEM